jgi:hypothetical protein
MMPFQGAGMSGKSKRENSPGEFGIAKIMLCSFHCNLVEWKQELWKLCFCGILVRTDCDDLLTTLESSGPLGQTRTPVLNVQLFEQVLNVGVRAEEDVQARLVPITIFVLPSGHLGSPEVANQGHNDHSWTEPRPTLFVPDGYRHYFY